MNLADPEQARINALWQTIRDEHRMYPCIWPGGCAQVVEYQDNTYCPEHMVLVQAMYNAPFTGAGLEAPTKGRKATDMSPLESQANRYGTRFERA